MKTRRQTKVEEAAAAAAIAPPSSSAQGKELGDASEPQPADEVADAVADEQPRSSKKRKRQARTPLNPEPGDGNPNPPKKRAARIGTPAPSRKRLDSANAKRGATGNPTSDGGNSKSAGDNPVSTAEIPTITGEIATSAGEIATSAGEIATSAGEIATSAGEIPTSAGEIPTSAGEIPTSAGEIPTSAGENPKSTGEMSKSAARRRPVSAIRRRGDPSSAGENPMSAGDKQQSAGGNSKSTGEKPNSAKGNLDSRKRKREAARNSSCARGSPSSRKRKREAGDPGVAGSDATCTAGIPKSTIEDESVVAGNPNSAIDGESVTGGNLKSSIDDESLIAGNLKSTVDNELSTEGDHNPVGDDDESDSNKRGTGKNAGEHVNLDENKEALKKRDVSFSKTRIARARGRWNNLTRRIVVRNTITLPSSTSSPSPSCKVPAKKVPKKWKESAKKMKLRHKNQQVRIMKHMIQWLTEANYLKKMNDASNPVDGRIFTMTENEREEFVQSMVKLCENDAKLRSSLLETVKVIVDSGLMVCSASHLLQEGPCEEAQSVLNAWEEYRQESSGRFPLNLLTSVNQLHKNRDLANKLKGHNISSEISESAWKLHIHSEDRVNLNGMDNM